MLFVEIPEYRNKHIRVPVKVNFYVINGKRKRSQPQHFTYHPGETFSLTPLRFPDNTDQGLGIPRLLPARLPGASDSPPLSLSFLLGWKALPCKKSSPYNTLMAAAMLSMLSLGGGHLLSRCLLLSLLVLGLITFRVKVDML